MTNLKRKCKKALCQGSGRKYFPVPNNQMLLLL